MIPDDCLLEGAIAVLTEHYVDAAMERDQHTPILVSEFVVGKPGFPNLDDAWGYKMMRPSLAIAFRRKRRRHWETVTVFSGSVRFCTIEQGSRTVFDSRTVAWPPDLILRREVSR